MQDFITLKKLVNDGVELTYGKMTLCDLSKYQLFRNKAKWQLYCSDNRESHYHVYESLDEALIKFLELKKKISNKIRNKVVNLYDRRIKEQD